MGSLLRTAPQRWGFLGVVVILLLGPCRWSTSSFVKVKMLPFDNKSEFQVIVDMPDGTTLEETARVAKTLAQEVLEAARGGERSDLCRTASPFNFNGLVRHYYLRRGPNVADIQVNLLPKHDRKQQSHEIAKQVRRVCSRSPTGSARASRWPRCRRDRRCCRRWWPRSTGRPRRASCASPARSARSSRATDGVVDVDWYVEDDQPK